VAERHTGRDTKQRLSVAQAADALGLTVDAVRSRIARDTIEHVKESGRVWILLSSDEYRQGRDQYTDKGSDQDRTDLIATLRDEIGHLRRESERKDTIIMTLSQANAEQARTIRAIEAPSDTGGASGSADSPAKAPADASNTQAPDDEKTASRKPWWRKLLGGNTRG
jgi:hypothetical protein